MATDEHLAKDGAGDFSWLVELVGLARIHFAGQRDHSMLRQTVVRSVRTRLIGWQCLLAFAWLSVADAWYALAAEPAAGAGNPVTVPPQAPLAPQLAPEESIDAEMARHMAGTWGDPSKVLGNLPGVLHSAPASDGLSVWGARPSETRVFVDGVEIPALLHLSGVRSAVGTSLVGRLDLVPGAYGADFGRALGGLVLISTPDLPAQGVHGAAEANLLDSSLLLTAAPSGRFRFGLAGTWSYLDRYHARLDETTTTLYQVPRYRDFQAKAELDLAPQRRLTLLVLAQLRPVRVPRRRQADLFHRCSLAALRHQRARPTHKCGSLEFQVSLAHAAWPG